MKDYDFNTTERHWAARWEELGIYRFEPNDTRDSYSIDTPPPTVSGSLHIGHCFSYTHADALARFWRMRGKNVFYPMGFDDNGLPTEKFVEQTHGVRAREMPRTDFIALCLKTVQEQEREFERLWRRLGLSVDWSRCYTTISLLVQKISQRSFLDLYKQGRIYRKAAPTLWCPHCQTAIAQADLEDRETHTRFVEIPFELETGTRATGRSPLRVATTRPELLAACVALFVHPDDARYKNLIGRRARTPIFEEPVPILSDVKADPEKGTGIVMCCTFGDTTDMAWWSEHKLRLISIIEPDGRVGRLAGPYAGLSIRDARRKIITDLEAQGRLLSTREIAHTVNVHERCGTEIEFLVRPQWFLKILDMKDELVRAGERIEWVPDFMGTRYRHWVENLKWDWCLSRQRPFGVPIPLWFCKNCNEVLLAHEDQLPVDPTQTGSGRVCPQCGTAECEPERDVLDTWATSSLTPQINMRWGEPDELKLIPMDLRPQAHEIIRTWAFYSIVKALVHHKKIPWKRAQISGWVVAEQGKISKSKGGGPQGPFSLIEKHSADALRYWACRGRPGHDTVFSEDVVAEGRRLLTKLWNAARFANAHLSDYDSTEKPALEVIDRWCLSKLNHTITQATGAFESGDYTSALAETERFFWRDLCDNYIEIIKRRLYQKEHRESRRAAQHTLYGAILNVLKLFAPFVPFITEELYQAHYAQRDGAKSIHIARWPSPEVGWFDAEAQEQGDLAIAIIEAVRKEKSLKKLALATPVKVLSIHAPRHAQLEPLISAIRDVTNAERIELCEAPTVEAIAVTKEITVVAQM
jgi:valyl-tRNA synthetase